MTPHVPGRARLAAWLDRVIVPRETAIAPSRWHQRIVQRRVSGFDHLRPHQLNGEALRHPEHAAGEDDDALTPRPAHRDVSLAAWPVVGARRSRPTTSPVGIA